MEPTECRNVPSEHSGPTALGWVGGDDGRRLRRVASALCRFCAVIGAAGAEAKMAAERRKRQTEVESAMQGEFLQGFAGTY